jgi:hypothetical protein
MAPPSGSTAVSEAAGTRQTLAVVEALFAKGRLDAAVSGADIGGAPVRCMRVRLPLGRDLIGRQIE